MSALQWERTDGAWLATHPDATNLVAAVTICERGWFCATVLHEGRRVHDSEHECLCDAKVNAEVAVDRAIALRPSRVRPPPPTPEPGPGRKVVMP